MINEVSEVERLTRELNSLNLRARQISERLEELGRSEEERNVTQIIPLRIGDTVRITTTYRNRRGTIGHITRLTRSTVWVIPRSSVAGWNIPRSPLANAANCRPIQCRRSSVVRIEERTDDTEQRYAQPTTATEPNRHDVLQPEQ